VFAVRDTGIGIPVEAQGRLFSSFTQVDASTTRKYGGTGLGLAISKRLAELMGGRMWLESGPGRGSTFCFTLRAEWLHRARPFVPAAQVQLRGRRLLAVDDNATNRRIVAGLAAKWGLQTTLAEGPEAALEILRRGERFDLAILDMQMPVMDGVMLARAIRELPGCGTLPLVLFSSIGRPQPKEHPGLFAACLTKPVKPSQLFDTLAGIFSDVKTEAAVEAVVSPEAAPAAGLGRILLAEDNTVNQKVALHMLSRLGYRADVAANGLEVLQAVERQPYDVILMDVQMPEMDGMEAAGRIKAAPVAGRPMPWIIALTANAMEGDREKCLAAGMDDYLGKPIKSADLVAALGRVRAKG
jgi:CheY-like chemotaxis protein